MIVEIRKKDPFNVTDGFAWSILKRFFRGAYTDALLQLLDSLPGFDWDSRYCVMIKMIMMI